MKNKLASILHFLDRDFTLSKRQVLFAFLALLIIGAGLRCSYWTMRDRPPLDENLYIQAVEKMTKNDDSWRKDYDSGTLMPILAANVSKLGIKPETALHMLNMGYAMLWVLVMFFLCRDVFDDDKAGLLGMSLAAFNPYSVRLSSQILREPLYILIFTLSLWCALRFIENKKYYLYPAMLGMLTILGFFVRYEGIEISLFLPLAIFVIFIQYKMQYVRVCVYSFAAYLLSVGLLVGALVNFNNSYMCNASQKAVGYFELFTGNRVK